MSGCFNFIQDQDSSRINALFLVERSFILTVVVLESTTTRLNNKAGYTATLVECGWAGAVFELLSTWASAVRPKTAKT